MSSLQQNWRWGQNRFCLEVTGVGGRGRGWRQGGEIAQTMYADMNKWINFKKKRRWGHRHTQRETMWRHGEDGHQWVKEESEATNLQDYGFLLLLLLIMGFESRASHLQGRYSTFWAMLPALFTLVILKIGSYFLPKPTWTVILLFCVSQHCWHDHAQKTFYPDWPGTTILPISASL
jgi:hypothetical protein